MPYDLIVFVRQPMMIDNHFTNGLIIHCHRNPQKRGIDISVSDCADVFISLDILRFRTLKVVVHTVMPFILTPHRKCTMIKNNLLQKACFLTVLIVTSVWSWKGSNGTYENE